MQNFQAKFEGYLTLHYRPAQLYTNKLGWYIEYATLTDDQKSFRRKHIKLNRLRKKCQTMMEFRTKAESIVTTINNQLQSHYAPMQTLPAYFSDLFRKILLWVHSLIRENVITEQTKCVHRISRLYGY